MADPIDLANDLIDQEVAFALKMNKLKQQAPVVESKYCAECGDVIQEARRKMGYANCITCASDAERRRAQYADSQ